MTANAFLCPEHIQKELHRYVAERVEPSHFLMDVLENNLREAFWCCRQNDELEDTFMHILSYVTNQLPGGVWGSRENVRQHLAGLTKMSRY